MMTARSPIRSCLMVVTIGCYSAVGISRQFNRRVPMDWFHGPGIVGIWPNVFPATTSMPLGLLMNAILVMALVEEM